MKQRLIRMAVVVAGAGGLVGLLETAAHAALVGNHTEPVR